MELIIYKNILVKSRYHNKIFNILLEIAMAARNPHQIFMESKKYDKYFHRANGGEIVFAIVLPAYSACRMEDQEICQQHITASLVEICIVGQRSMHQNFTARKSTSEMNLPFISI